MMTSIWLFFIAIISTSSGLNCKLSPSLFESFSRRLLQKVAISGLAFGLAATTPLLNSNVALADAIPLVGASAPDFKLPSNIGKAISLSDLSGKRTVLYFYPGDFTEGCTIEARGFEKDINKFKELNAQVIGVSVDSLEKHLDFSKKYGLDFPLLSDNGGVVSNKYGSLLDLGFIGKFSNRQTYIISPDLKVEYVFTNVESRVAQHSEDVLKVLQSLPNSST